MKRLLVVMVLALAISMEAAECPPPPQEQFLAIRYSGRDSGCSNLNSIDCRIGEPIAFEVATFNASFSACDMFSWRFNDGSPEALGRKVEHRFWEPRAIYPVQLQVFNASGITNLSQVVHFRSSEPTEVIDVRLTATPTTVKAGQPVVLTWSAPSATRVEFVPAIDQPIGAFGSAVVNPPKTVTYAVTAYGRSAIGYARVTVTVVDGRRRAVRK